MKKVFIILNILFLFISCEEKLNESNETDLTVIFFRNNDICDDQVFLTVKVKEGRRVEKPSPDPELDGFKFDGWYKESDCLDLYDFDTIITTSVFIHAGWKWAEQ